jgi:Uma2 family endonuclease
MVTFKNPVFRKKPIANVPRYLIYEIMDGKPVYYKGYKDVLSGKKTATDIMGSSTLQSFIIAYLQRILYISLSEDIFTILSSETGIHLNKYNNLAGDILIFDNVTLPIESINQYYADVPPKIAIEVDIWADVEDFGIEGYVHKKTQKLLDFGVEKVIWVTTATKKVMIATQNEDWQVKDWNKNIEVMEGITFNIGEYLTKKGSIYA